MNCVYAEFLKVVIDLDELSDVIARAGGPRYRLVPLRVKCTYPVFRGEADGAPSAFVKVGTEDEWLRTAKLQSEVGDCGLFAKLLVPRRLEYKGHAVFVMEWRETSLVRPEDMTDGEVDRFVGQCVALSAVLQKVTDIRAMGDLSLAPERLYEAVRRYAQNHPIAGRLLRDLLAIPVSERTLGDRPLAVVHGDFHAKNFGFDADGRMCVFDFDKMMRALACGDLANALVERFSCLGLSAAARRRLRRVTGRAVAKSPWPRADFVIVGNLIRLQFAARRVENHPRSVWLAFDIWRRDRRLREFLEALRESIA